MDKSHSLYLNCGGEKRGTFKAYLGVVKIGKRGYTLDVVRSKLVFLVGQWNWRY